MSGSLLHSHETPSTTRKRKRKPVAAREEEPVSKRRKLSPVPKPTPKPDPMPVVVFDEEEEEEPGECSISSGVKDDELPGFEAYIADLVCINGYTVTSIIDLIHDPDFALLRAEKDREQYVMYVTLVSQMESIVVSHMQKVSKAHVNILDWNDMFVDIIYSHLVLENFCVNQSISRYLASVDSDYIVVQEVIRGILRGLKHLHASGYAFGRLLDDDVRLTADSVLRKQVSAKSVRLLGIHGCHHRDDDILVYKYECKKERESLQELFSKFWGFTRRDGVGKTRYLGPLTPHAKSFLALFREASVPMVQLFDRALRHDYLRQQ